MNRFDEHASAPPDADEWQRETEAQDAYDERREKRMENNGEFRETPRAALPEFTPHRSGPVIAPPSTPAFDPDSEETRMSRAQLADRIRQMEATEAAISTTKRFRPMERQRRRDKITRYRAELNRRDEATLRAELVARAASQPAADTREEEALDRAFPGRVIGRQIKAEADARYYFAPPPPPPSTTPAAELATAAEDLVRRFTCPTVLDAIWDASHRIFKPNQGDKQR